LLPDVHITTVTEDRVLRGLEELFLAVDGQLPSNLAIVSGPSRSADIEQVLALGVHGPREEHVVILPAREAAPPAS
jgi:L-lactate dehydrogenase complex protein LldG